MEKEQRGSVAQGARQQRIANLKHMIEMLKSNPRNVRHEPGGTKLEDA